MQTPPLPQDESARQRALESLNLLETPIEERFERVTRLASRLLHVPVAALTLVDGERQWFKSVQGADFIETGRDISFCGHTILSDDPLIVEDAASDERFADNPLVIDGPQIRFYAGVPVHGPDGHRIGSLCLIDREPRRLSEAEIEDLKDLASMVEVEIQSQELAAAQLLMNAELEQARRAVLVDPLTRLWNRAGGDEFLSRQHQLAVQRGEKFCLAMLDIDHFKQINDTHGHDAGDHVLREVARRILRGIRPRDFACRRGGEEFLIMIADPLATDALGVAEAVRASVKSSPVLADGKEIRVTASIGLAWFDPASAAPCEEVIRLADENLYRAKNSGRDRIVSHIEKSG